MRHKVHFQKCHDRAERLGKRIGRRGAILIILGGWWVFAGLPLFFAPSADLIPILPSHLLLTLWASIFTVAGSVALVTAFTRSPFADKIGYLFLALSGWGWVMWTATLSTLHIVSAHYPTLWAGTIQNALLLSLIMVCAGWNEPIEPVDLEHNLHLVPDPELDSHEQ